MKTIKNGILATVDIAKPCDELPESVIDELIANYNTEIHAAPIVINHPKGKSPFAWGWVQSLKKVNNNMAADLILTPEFAELYDRGFLSNKSISFRPEFEKTGKPYFMHLGFLGSEIPRIKGIPDNLIKQSELNYQDLESDIQFTEKELNLELKILKEKKKMAEYTQDQLDAILESTKTNFKKELDIKFSEEITAKEKVINDRATEITGLQAKITELQTTIDGLKEKFANTEITNFIEKSISEGKIKPADKENKIKILQLARKSSDVLYAELIKDIDQTVPILETGTDKRYSEENIEKELHETSIAELQRKIREEAGK